MNIPPTFAEALRRKIDIVLETGPDEPPRLVSADKSATWELTDFNDRAAFLFADTLLDQYGYELARPRDAQSIGDAKAHSTPAARWKTSDP